MRSAASSGVGSSPSTRAVRSPGPGFPGGRTGAVTGIDGAAAEGNGQEYRSDSARAMGHASSRRGDVKPSSSPREWPPRGHPP